MPYNATAEEAVAGFFATADITPLALPHPGAPAAPPAALDAMGLFRNGVEQIARNEVGKFVLIAIVNLLRDLPSKPKKLIIEVNDESPDFVPSTVKTYAKIAFSSQPLSCHVIDPTASAIFTVSQPAPPHVSLFHELLHWARHLACIRNPLPLYKNQENSQSFFHHVLEDHPGRSRWVEQLRRDYSAALNDHKKALAQKLRYVVAVAFPFPELNCWKQCTDKLVKALIPLSAECIGCITNDVPGDPDVLGRLRMPYLNVEEIRNIVGGSPPSECVTVADTIVHLICENGYRLASELPLRYGHVSVSCKIDEDVIKWCQVRARRCVAAVIGQGG